MHGKSNMIPRPQNLLIILLALLQFAAPLVHAHVGPGAVGLGVHVPGLELLSVGADPAQISSSHLTIHQEASLVSISAAIQQKHPFISANGNLFIDLSDGIYSVALDVRLLNFSPPVNPSIPDFFDNPHAARAPPRL